VASFGRSAVRLNVDSVILMLQACLGGNAKDYNVLHLSGWMFKFSVSCKDAGFMIYKIKSFSCKSFRIFIHLWGGGGPNWRRDFELWHQEQEAEWHFVGPKSKKSYSDAVKSRPNKSVFLRLAYPNNYASRFTAPPKILDSQKSSIFFPLPRRPPPSRSPARADSFKFRNPSISSASQGKLFSRPTITGANQGNKRPESVFAERAKSSLPLECNNCLGLGHIKKDCTGLVRCRQCWNYGHISRQCLHKRRIFRRYRPILRIEGQESQHLATDLKQCNTLGPSVPPSTPDETVHPHPADPPMANWACDPRPFIPEGFSLEDRSHRPHLRQEVFVTGCYSLCNEDLAIVKLNPPVDKADFKHLAEALRTFFLEVHQVRTTEILPCAIGDAYVRFLSPLDRERFLGPIFQFGNYAMSLVKHDAAENARSFQLDREAWVLLVANPEDLKNSAMVAKAVSGFGIMEDWHEMENVARVIVKVYLNDDAKIPDSIKVNAGVPQRG